MKRQRQLTIAIISLIWTCTATAEAVYKSVDAQGRVTYSSTPPPDAPGEMVEEVSIEPGPTEQQQQEAMERAKKLQEVTQRADEQRQEQAAEAAQARSDAEQELKDAEAALEEARIRHPDDWQFLAGGGRVLKPSYRERVEAAEKKVEEAQKAVRSAR
jgi:chaperonin cofactor prefoldin